MTSEVKEGIRTAPSVWYHPISPTFPMRADLWTAPMHCAAAHVAQHPSCRSTISQSHAGLLEDHHQHPHRYCGAVSSLPRESSHAVIHTRTAMPNASVTAQSCLQTGVTKAEVVHDCFTRLRDLPNVYAGAMLTPKKFDLWCVWCFPYMITPKAAALGPFPAPSPRPSSPAFCVPGGRAGRGFASPRAQLDLEICCHILAQHKPRTGKRDVSAADHTWGLPCSLCAPMLTAPVWSSCRRTCICAFCSHHPPAS